MAGEFTQNFDVDVARFPLEIIPASARIVDLSGGGNETVCAISEVNPEPQCWGRFLTERSTAQYHNAALIGRCQDDLPPQGDDFVAGACVPEPVGFGHVKNWVPDWDELFGPAFPLSTLVGPTTAYVPFKF